MFIDLLGKQLKDDRILELLECNEVDVIYEFDRTHEGLSDIYWAPSKNEGYLFRFDCNQKLDTIFLYMISHEGYSPIAHDIIDVPIYNSFIEAKTEFENENLVFTQGELISSRWIKIKRDSYSIHYDFKNDVPRRITISAL